MVSVRIYKIVIAVLVVSNLAIALQSSLIPRLWGTIWPVATRLVITSITDAPEGSSLISAEATKLTPFGCGGVPSFQRIEWFLGTPDHSVQVFAKIYDKPELRRDGLQRWTRINVGLFPRDVLTNSFADAIHKCPNLPWDIRTRIYESPHTN